MNADAPYDAVIIFLLLLTILLLIYHGLKSRSYFWAILAHNRELIRINEDLNQKVLRELKQRRPEDSDQSASEDAL